jgi:hypothetical protein
MDVWCVCAFCSVCVVLYLGRGLATSWSPVQGVPPSVNDQDTEKSVLCSKVGAKRKKQTHHQWLHVIIALSLFLHFIIYCYTYTSRLLVTQWKHRNYNNLTELHSPNTSITHKVSSSQPHSCS